MSDDTIQIPDWLVYLVGRLTLEREALLQPKPEPQDETPKEQ